MSDNNHNNTLGNNDGTASTGNDEVQPNEGRTNTNATVTTDQHQEHQQVQEEEEQLLLEEQVSQRRRRIHEISSNDDGVSDTIEGSQGTIETEQNASASLEGGGSQEEEEQQHENENENENEAYMDSDEEEEEYFLAMNALEPASNRSSNRFHNFPDQIENGFYNVPDSPGDDNTFHSLMHGDDDDNPNDHNDHDGSSLESDTHNNNSNEEEEEGNDGVETASSIPPPPARQHTYLPGITNPLFPQEWLLHSESKPTLPPDAATTATTSTIPFSQATMSSNNPQQERARQQYPSRQSLLSPTSKTSTTTVPILELDGVVLFPGGSTLPLRLYDTEWINYLGSKIDAARSSLIGTNTTSTHSKEPIEVKIGVLTKTIGRRRDAHVRRRRRRFVRSNIDENPQQSNNNNNDETEGNVNVNEQTTTTRRMGRWNIGMIRRGRYQSDRNRNNDDENSSNDDDDDDDESNSDEYLYPTQPPVEPIDPLVGRIGTFATITCTHEENEEDYWSGNGQDQQRQQQQRRRRQQQRRQIVATAVSTGRFRIVSKSIIQDNLTHIPARQSVCQMYNVQEVIDENLTPPSSILHQNRPHFDSEKSNITESYTASTSTISNQSHNDEQSQSSNISLQYHKRVCSKLAQVTPIPSFAYQMIWPWKLVEDIVNEIMSNPSLKGLQDSLPPSSGRSSLSNIKDDDNLEKATATITSLSSESKDGNDVSTNSDPVNFSFWMSANLPLSESERLDLLEMDCVVERLRLIRQEVIKQREANKSIQCVRCGSEIANFGDAFTLKGAEGTTGAYVNEHGIVHQTVTLTRVKPNSVICYGGAETKDSWFPGYSWTITYCKTCQFHLGWKFQLVSHSSSRHSSSNDEGKCIGNTELDDKPTLFWGLSGSNITTENSTSAPRRI